MNKEILKASDFVNTGKGGVISKQEFVNWFFSSKPYFPTPNQCYDKIIETASPETSLLNTGKADEWISVNDKSPERGQRVLCLWAMEVVSQFQPNEITIERLIDFDGFRLANITHWQPLPVSTQTVK